MNSHSLITQLQLVHLGNTHLHSIPELGLPLPFLVACYIGVHPLG
jgi:hypothetical protein